MKTASILLALVAVLGFVNEAKACMGEVVNNRTIVLGGNAFGFYDMRLSLPGIDSITWTEMQLGAFGPYRVPFTAIQGLIGFCLIVVAFVAMLVGLSVRRKKKRATV